MENKNDLLEFILQVTRAANAYEESNTDLKKEYIRKNIEIFNKIILSVPGNCGSFGTGYPFYALRSDFDGELPIISEQIRYDQELLDIAKKSKRTIWGCRGCLTRNYDKMPDLKQRCKPCTSMDDGLKPRKVINRLPDIDMWLVCADGHVQDAEQILSRLFSKYGLKPSDIDPVQTIKDVKSIAESLERNEMPKVLLPLDAHIIEYAKLRELIQKVPKEIDSSIESGSVPYLSIYPKSYRKTWQFDDMEYNFVHDFLLSFTDFNFTETLGYDLSNSRRQIAQKYTDAELYEILQGIQGDSTKRRFKSAPSLAELYMKRMDSWRRIEIKEKENEKGKGEYE